MTLITKASNDAHTHASILSLCYCPAQMLRSSALESEEISTARRRQLPPCETPASAPCAVLAAAQVKGFVFP